MSEGEEAFRKFMDALYAERDASSGCYPAVCVVGWLDYDTLHGAAVAMMCATRTIDIPKVAGQSFEFMGVKVFKTYSHEYGFYFGSVEQ